MGRGDGAKTAARLFLLGALAALAADGVPQAVAGMTRGEPPADRNAYLRPVPGLLPEQRLDFAVGQALFERLWVAAPASTRSADGLGPLYNARSCQSCHPRNGRGALPTAGNGARAGELGLVLRLSIPADDAAAAHDVGMLPEPTYGMQLQDFAIAGYAAESRLDIQYRPLRAAYADGEVVELRQPRYAVEPAFGPLDRRVMTSPRLAPPLIGLGLVSRIPESAILANADPTDANGDGISGRPNWVGKMAAGHARLGRFGWKANEATLDEQVAAALALDIGISSPLRPEGYGDCTPREPACLASPDGNTPEFGNVEAPETVTREILLYVSSIAVPPPRDTADAEVVAGRRLFAATGCTGCHRPRFVTGTDAERPELSRREIFPYSDFLLHDMGEGLADGRPEGSATGREWRTAPLWGIGRTAAVNGHAFYLHDGRARDLAEAILWHDGEAAAAKRRFLALPRADRASLLRFLVSL